MFALIRACLALALTVLASLAHAETLQAPIGGRPISIGSARVACAAPGGGWTVDGTGHLLRPPAQDDAIGKAVELKIAANIASCAESSSSLRLIATGVFPVIDPNSVLFSADQNSVEAHGRRLRGVALAWRSDTASGMDVCQPRLEPNAERCVWSVGRGLSADPGAGALVWVPAGGRPGPDVTTFDADGNALAPAYFVLPPARVILTSLLPPDASIDLSQGRGEVPLFHPEVLRSAECSPARCEVSGGKLYVRGISSEVTSVDVRFTLAPKVVLTKKDGSEAKPAAHLSVLHCPMSVASGPPLRGVDATRVVVRIDERCARRLDALAFEVDEEPAHVIESEVDAQSTYILLDVGRLEKKTVSIAALNAQGDDDVVAMTRIDTIPAPYVRATLEIPGHKNLDFIPNNRAARVHTPGVPAPGRLAVIPMDGVYHVVPGAEAVVGDPDAAGLATLRFGYRVDSLPGNLRHADLAVLSDALQRSVHEANLPAPIGASAYGPHALVELVCGPTQGGVQLVPGLTAHLAFSRRDDCRVIFHRERIRPEYGTQKLNLSIEVNNADGASRSEGHVAQTLTLRHGDHPIYAWSHGVQGQFDRVIVRLSHAADEAHYIGAHEIDTGSPAVKWTAVFGLGRARLYATTAIPTGLYRFGDAQHSGVLSLNFGLVSRLTWLDSDGHEGFIGLEAGIMAIGISNDKSTSGAPLTQVGVVTGLGIAIPIANRAAPTQASINLHGWLEEDISHGTGNRFAFILGPSISIGNVGANL